MQYCLCSCDDNGCSQLGFFFFFRYNFSFIRLADYLIVNTMHVLAVNSVSTLLNLLSEQLANTPSLAEIQGWNKEDEAVTDGDSKAPDDDAKVCIHKLTICRKPFRLQMVEEVTDSQTNKNFNNNKRCSCYFNVK